MRVGVVGAGAVGVSAALELADHGADVTVFDRGEVAAGATGRAAGVCYDAFADRRDARLAGRALTLFRERCGEDDAFTDCPYVWLARDGDKSRASTIREQVPRMRAHGLDIQLVTPADLADRYPGLETADVTIGAIAENAGYTDPRAYTRATAASARAADAEIRERTPVTLAGDGRTLKTTTSDFRFDAVLVAAGAHSGRLLADAGLPIATKPYRVQALVTESVDRTLPMLYDATGGYYVRPRDGGVLVGDGTEPVAVDPDNWPRAADEWFLDACADHLRTALGKTVPVARAWAGLCTATPDGDPLAGERTPGVFVATGWQGHGFMRAPAFGERLAAQVLGETWTAFDPTRFDGDEPFEIVEGMRVENR